MSKSIHVTKKNFKGLTKREIDEQVGDPGSDLEQWAKKKSLKKAKKKLKKGGSVTLQIRF